MYVVRRRAYTEETLPVCRVTLYVQRVWARAGGWGYFIKKKLGRFVLLNYPRGITISQLFFFFELILLGWIVAIFCSRSSPRLMRRGAILDTFRCWTLLTILESVTWFASQISHLPLPGFLLLQLELLKVNPSFASCYPSAEAVRWLALSRDRSWLKREHLFVDHFLYRLMFSADVGHHTSLPNMVTFFDLNTMLIVNPDVHH